MEKISNKRFATIQKMELEWWTNTPHDPRRPWWYYDRAFLPFIDGPLGTVADIGCGPVPYFLNHNIIFSTAYAVDPLIFEYWQMDKYSLWPYTKAKSFPVTDSRQICDESVDTAFMLNTLDHVQDPMFMLNEAYRILVFKGRLFLFVDMDKKPDLMHPHRIDASWLEDELEKRFEHVMSVVRESWKFDNLVMYYIGRKR
jgi:SAM-dependent methyltransferase